MHLKKNGLIKKTLQKLNQPKNWCRSQSQLSQLSQFSQLSQLTMSLRLIKNAEENPKVEK